MLGLALATLRGRVVGFVASFVVLLLASALVTACGILMETGIRGGAEPDRYAVAPVIVAGADSLRPPGGTDIDSSALTERARVGDAVANDVRDVRGVARVEWVDPGLALGVHGGGDPGELRDRVAEALPEHTLRAYAGEDRAVAEFPQHAQARTMLLALSGSAGGTAQLIAVFVVAGTFGLLIQQRHRELALLRAVGATPRQVRTMILREVQVVATAAGVLGVAPGVALAYWLRGELAARGFVPPGFSLTVSPVPMVAAVLLGIGVAWLATWTAAYRATRIRPVEALGEAAVERRELGRGRAVAGVLVVVLGLTSLVTVSRMGGQIAAAAPAAASLVLIVAAALLGPLIVRGAYRLTGWIPARISPVSGYLAAAATRTSTRRRASAVAPLMLMVAFAGTSVFVETTQAHAADEQARGGTRAEYVLTPEEGAAGLPDTVAEQARALPGDPAVTEVVNTRVLTEESLDPTALLPIPDEAVPEDAVETMLMPATAQGVTTADLTSNLDLDVRSGSLDDLEGETVALSELTAEAADVRVGDQMDLWMGDGAKVRLRVVATYGRGLGFGAVTLPFDLARAHTTERLADQVLVSGADAASVEGLALASPEVGVTDRRGGLASRQRTRELDAWVDYALLGVISAYVAISVVNTLVMATGERVREFALLRLVGTTRRQLLGMLRWEALFIGGLALVVGGAGVLIALVPFSLAMTGTPVPYVPPLVGFGIVAVTLLVALLAMVVPARVALRTPPAEALTKPM
ncbi:putative ABC transport system permease protein [Nocardiopsis arvandica]|uniref:Putative ABC transport system permease protein n=1 Tax=Nocardiopsis sinuspersici TaxID=501010 RepID=A0A7Y9XEQ1_9ACTN|nr:FtsX-like permease family protein [Nocardiopsis sinuspersici]NYH53203.1 putative ABC transport system permease protein [Nocardiopsis sinuspersici]